jgi:hypothetical protein
MKIRHGTTTIGKDVVARQSMNADIADTVCSVSTALEFVLSQKLGLIDEAAAGA